jgi:phosphatidylserine/phosphatidylglycerophosphate/cardiolipin synthase-like enzyme
VVIRQFRAAINIAILPLILITTLFLVFSQSPIEAINDHPQLNPSSDTWDVFFSEPTDPLAGTYKGGPDTVLVDALDNAQFSIDMAIYHLNLWSVRDALIRAENRGIDVRVIVDDVHAGETEVVALRNAGIEVLSDRSQHLMHHKFVLVDRIEVWTGSMNLTVNGAYRNDNNLLRIRVREIADNYLREFEEMFIQKRFGSASLSDTPHRRTEWEGIELETYFSPDDGVVYRIVDLINGAKEKIDLLAFAITSDPISNALLRAAERGIEIRGVVEESQSRGMGSDFSTLIAAGLDVRLDGNRNLMHHKVMIVDSRIVLLGSYNFTRSAEEKNDENTIIVYDPALAEQFLIEFERLYESATE